MPAVLYIKPCGHCIELALGSLVSVCDATDEYRKHVQDNEKVTQTTHVYIHRFLHSLCNE
jgi:hypothetical protein